MNTAQKPRIMYIDMAYTLKMVRERELEQEFSSRDCGGYFEYVWGVHPMADVPEKRIPDYKGFKVSETRFSENQTIIEGSSAYYPGLKGLFPLNFLLSQVRFTRYLIHLVKKEDISIILCTEPYFSGLIGLFIRFFTKSKLVIWVVANNDDIYKATGATAMPRLYKLRWIEKMVERFVFRRADLVAGANQNNLEYALNNGARLSRSTVFPVGKLIHPQHMKDPALREKESIFDVSKADYHFVYVGRMLDLKHPDDVIRAFAEISSRIPSCALIMAGDGPMKPELEQMTVDLRIQNKVHFLGNISQLRIANLLAGCFTVLSPLTGRSLIESALAGLPIIAYDRDWQVDFVEKNKAGVIVPFRDWKKMAETAVRFIQHPDVAKRFATASRKAGLEACDNEKLYNHEKKEFEKLLNR